MDKFQLKEFLDFKSQQYNTLEFIKEDPISIPHKFSNPIDVEIMGFLMATLSWGRRDQIIKSGNRLLEIMGESPYDFILNYDISEVISFQYRTFNKVDLHYFFKALKRIYLQSASLEECFYLKNGSLFDMINKFRGIFFKEPMSESEQRTFKHVSNPLKGASAKRLCMYLRWMVRKDEVGVDFGIWNRISPASLCLPLDVHTGNVGRALGLLKRKQNDWKSVEEITKCLRKLDSEDPIKYDFALFGLGRYENFGAK